MCCHSCTPCLSPFLCSPPLVSLALLLCFFLRWSHAQALPSSHHLESLHLPIPGFIFYLPLVTSPFLSVLPLFLIHCLALFISLSELSVQTVEYMSSKYTSPLSLCLNKLQQGERKREAVRQEEGRMSAQRGDEAWKKENIQVKQHLHVQRLQN